MIIATVRVLRTEAETVCCRELPLGAVGLQVGFAFADPVWQGLSKTAVFRTNSQTLDAALCDNCAVIPHELLSRIGEPLYVGVYGTDSQNTLAVPTVWTKLGCISSASIPSDNLSAEATLPYWVQIQEQVEQLRIRISQIQNGSGTQNPDGGTGDAPSLVYASVMYQAGDSGTSVPTGIWTEDIPQVEPGGYLWTRILQQFSTGEPIIAYSVSRMGKDSRFSVCGIFPDDAGNIPLSAADIGALSVNGGDMVGAVNMNQQRLYGLREPQEDSEAATKGYALAKEQVVNDFTVTEEGFAADARALKTLSDRIDSGFSTVLLWENNRPNDEFLDQSIALDFSPYSHILIDFVGAVSSVTVRKGMTAYINHLNVTSTASNEIVIELRRRTANFSDTQITFSHCNSSMYTTTSGKFSALSTNDGSAKPFRIYGIKGGI